ncbi:MAG: DUF1552 domain-containing protein [Sandaracinaceae bacterium]
MNRRDFMKLAGISGLAAAAPFGARFAGATGATCPKFLFVVEGNGFEPASVLCDSARAALDATMSGAVDTKRWWCNSYRHDSPMELSTPDLAQSSYLSSQFGTAFPLEPLAEQGLVDQSTVLLGLSSRIVGGGHSGMHGALSSTRTIGGRPGGPTIDAYLAGIPEVRQDTPFDAFRIGVGGGGIDFGTCAYGYGRPAPVIRDESEAYAFAYGAFASGNARQVFEQRDRMLRFAAEDVRAAEARFTGNPGELAKLGTYEASIDELLQSQERLRSMTVTAPPAPMTGLSPLPQLAQLLDMAAGALIDGLTNVAVVTSGTGGAFGMTYSTVSSTARHDMQHQSGGNPTLLDAIRQVNRAQVDAIAKAARRLADASILDQTIIVWIGDNGEQHHSTSSEFPILLIGGSGVGLKPGGRTVLYPGLSSANHRQLSNLWNTLGHVAGVALDEFGGEAGNLRKAPGPLPELLA